MNSESKEREQMELSKTMDHEGSEHAGDIPAEWKALRTHLQGAEDLHPPDADWMFARIQREMKNDSEAVNVSTRSTWLKWAASVTVFLGVASGLMHTGLQTDEFPEAGGVLWVETYLPDSSSIVYEDVETGVTVVWMISEEDA